MALKVKEAVIRVVVVDDHELVCNALSRLLATQPDMKVVGQASTAGQADTLLRSTHPDVLVLDLVLPDRSGREFALQLLEEDTDVAVLIVSSRLDPGEIHLLLEAGIRGYVPKTAPADEFVRAVRDVGRGLYHLSPDASSALAGSLRSSLNDRSSPLTLRQTVVLERISRGQTTKEIAEALSLSPKTVEKYRGGILRKLQCKNQVQAIEAARKLKLLD
jgi:DNA-binding NarL/FixJ family response regulator